MAAHDETLELLQRWHGGDRHALASLVERDRQWVEERVRQRRGDTLRRHGETMDDFQDLMLRALQYSPRFLCANRRQFRGLLARMIENLVTDKVRRLGSRQREVHFESLSNSQLSLDPAIASATGPADAAARNEDVAWLHLGLQFLEDDEREIVWQRQFLARPFSEIGAAFAATEDAVRMRFQRILLRLAGIVQRLQAGQLESLLAKDAAP